MAESTELDPSAEVVAVYLTGARTAAVRMRAFAAEEYGVSGDDAFDAAAALDRVSDAIERVLAIHRAVPLEYEAYSVCSECNPQTWPCSTVLALASDRSE